MQERRANAFKDEMGPEETVNPLARGLSSAILLLSLERRLSPSWTKDSLSKNIKTERVRRNDEV